MTGRMAALAAVLAAAAVCLVVAAAHVSPALAWAAAGVLLGGWGVLVLADTRPGPPPGDER